MINHIDNAFKDLVINTYFYDLSNKSIVEINDIIFNKDYILITEIDNKGKEIDFNSIDIKLYDKDQKTDNVAYLIEKGFLANKIKSGFNYFISDVKLDKENKDILLNKEVISKMYINRLNNEALETNILEEMPLLNKKDDDLKKELNEVFFKNLDDKATNFIFSYDMNEKNKKQFLSFKNEKTEVESKNEVDNQTEIKIESENELNQDEQKEENNNENLVNNSNQIGQLKNQIENNLDNDNFNIDKVGDIMQEDNLIQENTSVTVKNKPKLIVSNYQLTPEMAKAGEEFKLNLTFYNTNYEKSVRNIKISLNGSSQSVGANGEQASGSVFTPVNSSNTFYISRIDPEDTVSKEITIKTVPNAPAQNYSMEIKFEYEDYEGNEYVASEVIGIPVVQTSKILYGEVNLTEGFVGDIMNLSMDFYNTGKDTLTTFMVTVEGNDFTVNGSQRYFVGNFAPGNSDNFNVDITPTKAGELNGKVVITYEDSTGEEHKEEIPFKTEVMEAMQIEDPMINPETGELLDGTMVEESTPLYKKPSLWVGIAVLIVVIAFFVRRRAKKKKEQDFLDINE